MRVTMDLSGKQLHNFYARCDAIVTKVGNGSRKALVAACNAISDESLAQVPRETNTLALSQYWEVTGNYKIGWTAVIGYGGNGDPVNPVTGKPASSYMLAVHEDLDALHIQGKAKFLEDPIRSYAAQKFPRTVIKHLQDSLQYSGGTK